MVAQRSGVVALPLADLGQALRRLKRRAPCADFLGQRSRFRQKSPRRVQRSLPGENLADGEQRVGGDFLVLNGTRDFQGLGITIQRLRLTPCLAVSEGQAGQRDRHLFPVLQPGSEFHRPPADRNCFVVTAQIRVIAA